MTAWLSNLRGDIIGGIVSAVVATPLVMGYGMFAFVALGESYFAERVVMGPRTIEVARVRITEAGRRALSPSDYPHQLQEQRQ